MSRPEIELEIDYRLKALSLDRLNESSESYYQSMGKIFNDIDWQLAGKYYKKSIESGFVSRYTTNEQYQIEYRSRNFGEALRYALKTLDLAPGRLQSNMDVAFSYLQNHQFEKSDEYFDKSKNLYQEIYGSKEIYWFMGYHGLVKIQRGMVKEGQAMINAFKDHLYHPDNYDEDLIIDSEQDYFKALMLAYEGEIDDAITHLNNYFTNDHDKTIFDDLLNLQTDPFLDNLRQDDRFKKIVQGLLDIEENKRQLFQKKLNEYHKRKELKWLKLNRL